MTNAQYDYVLTIAKQKNINLNRCPTCRQSRTEVAPGVCIWKPSTYRIYGQEHPCDCQRQSNLRTHYLLANLPMAYWTLSPDDWFGDPEALVAAQKYLHAWEDNKWFGHGIEFYSPRLGVGKTMLAVIIAKALVQMINGVYFTSFRNAMTSYTSEGTLDQIERLQTSPVLVLDEVGVGWTDKMHTMYADYFERLVRNRTDGLGVTIMTTNMTPEEMGEDYARCFSLLSAKQTRVHVQGKDVRLNGTVAMADEELKANSEVRPIR